MSARHEPDQITAEEWGQAVASSEFDYDYPDEREELTIERIQEMLDHRQFKDWKIICTLSTLLRYWKKWTKSSWC